MGAELASRVVCRRQLCHRRVERALGHGVDRPSQASMKAGAIKHGAWTFEGFDSFEAFRGKTGDRRHTRKSIESQIRTIHEKSAHRKFEIAGSRSQRPSNARGCVVIQHIGDGTGLLVCDELACVSIAVSTGSSA